MFKAIAGLYIVSIIVGCSSENVNQSNKNLVPQNNNIRLISETEIKLRENGVSDEVREYCANGNLIIFIDSYRSGGAISLGKSTRCVEK